jgi:hypothetical protein
VVRKPLLPVALASTSLSFVGLFVFLGLLVACGGHSSSTTQVPPAGTTNVQQIVVNGGPVSGQRYPDAAFTSVTICAPKSTNCATVDGILVDTGSFGLRILKSAIPSLSLPTLSQSGSTIYNCVSFVDNSFLFGQVAQADVKIAGEVASAASIHVVADPTGFAVPAACSNGGVDADNQQTLGANGILGVGAEPEDCGFACDPSTGGQPPAVYFACGTTGNCNSAFVSVSQQVINPVVRFSKDNNGVLVKLPSINGVAATATGSLIFGIGTQTNNSLPTTATVFTLDSFGNFTTHFNNQALTRSFIDSGSNGLFFPDSAIPQCPANAAPGFYCPTTTLNLSAQNSSQSGASNTVNFSIDNAVNVFNGNPTADAFSNLGGSSSSGTFDWGLPFFYGRTVFTSINGQPVPTGQPAAPWWAY